MRKMPDPKQKQPNGRPMANAGGLKRQNKRLRQQIRQILKSIKIF